MDFHTLLYQAQKNNAKDKDVKYYKASFDPPKKESKESRQLSDSIKKFLAKKEEEDRQKQLEEKKKKEELLSLRSQDRKSFKRVQSMLNRTKSANKSVIEDAKDDVNTSVTMAGFHQPDEDDYGYASKDAMDIYDKIMNKYVNTPSETKIATAHHRSHDISGTKDRVKAALLKEEEDQLLPHKRKRKPKEVENNDDHPCDTEEPQQKKPKTDKSTERIKKRPAQPPPLNFQELLKIAEKKQFEPIIIEKPKKEENVPMMTKKEREKYLEEKRIEAMRAARRQGNLPRECSSSTEKPKDVKPVEQIQKPIASSKIDVHAELKLQKKSSVWSKDLKISKEQNNNHGKVDKYIPKTTSGSENARVKSSNPSNRNMSQNSVEKNSNEKKYSSSDERYSPKPKSVSDRYIPKIKNPVEHKYLPKSRNSPSNEKYVPKPSCSTVDKYSTKPKSLTASDKYSCKTNSTEKYVPKPKMSVDEKYSPKPKTTVQPERYVPKGNGSSVEKYTPSVKRPDEKYVPKPVSSSSTKLKPSGSKDKYVPTSIDRAKKLHPNNIKPKQFPPRDVPKQFPPRDLAPKQFPPPDMKRRDDRRMPIRNKRQIIESDSEYDSELDDFIDDGPEDEADYSKVISEIFKYDKSKYRGVDDDDECMESDFRTLQKEEYQSTRAGIMEDLADIRREKAMMKRRKKI